MDLKTIIVSEKDLSLKQLEEIKLLNKECFANISQEEVDEDFIAESFARVIAYNKNNAVGTLHLYKRDNNFEGKEVVLGGIGGVCVTESERGKGIATKMCEEGLKRLKTEGCDVACLNVDLAKEAYKVYEKLGFTFMEREFSFTNSKGEIKYDTGTMFVPVNSNDIYNLIMNSKETFHYGIGYW